MDRADDVILCGAWCLQADGKLLQRPGVRAVETVDAGILDHRRYQ